MEEIMKIRDLEVVAVHAALEGSNDTLQLILDYQRFSKKFLDELFCFACGYCSLKTIEQLIKLGVDPVNCYYVENRHRNYPIHHAVAGGNVEALRFLIDKGVDVNKLGYYDNISDVYDNLITPLHVAIEYDECDCMDLLIVRGADVNKIDSEGLYTPLAFAAQNDAYEIVKILIEAKADLNLRYNKESFTPLIHAVREGNEQLAELLLENGADPNVKVIWSDTGEISDIEHFIMCENADKESMLELIADFRS